MVRSRLALNNTNPFVFVISMLWHKAIHLQNWTNCLLAMLEHFPDRKIKRGERREGRKGIYIHTANESFIRLKAPLKLFTFNTLESDKTVFYVKTETKAGFSEMI